MIYVGNVPESLKSLDRAIAEIVIGALAILDQPSQGTQQVLGQVEDGNGQQTARPVGAPDGVAVDMGFALGEGKWARPELVDACPMGVDAGADEACFASLLFHESGRVVSLEGEAAGVICEDQLARLRPRGKFSFQLRRDTPADRGLPSPIA